MKYLYNENLKISEKRPYVHESVECEMNIMSKSDYSFTTIPTKASIHSSDK